MTHTLLFIRINEHSWLFGEELVHTSESKEKERRHRERGKMGEASHNFLPTKFIEHLLGHPYLCGWCKTEPNPALLEHMLFSFSRSQNLHHITHLLQKVLLDCLSQKYLHFKMDAIERPLRTSGRSEGLRGEWGPSWHPAHQPCW